MDWRAFIHDHAIVVLVAAVVVSLVAGSLVMALLPGRHHLLRGAFVLLAWLAMAACLLLVLLGLNIVPDLGLASRDVLIAALAGIALLIVLLLWRVGHWWVAHVEEERDAVAQKLKEAKARVTLTVANQAHGPKA